MKEDSIRCDSAVEKDTTTSKIIVGKTPLVEGGNQGAQNASRVSAEMEKSATVMPPCEETTDGYDATHCEPELKTPTAIVRGENCKLKSSTSALVSIPSDTHYKDSKNQSSSVSPPLDAVVYAMTSVGSSINGAPVKRIETAFFPNELPPPHSFSPPRSLFRNSFDEHIYDELVLSPLEQDGSNHNVHGYDRVASSTFETIEEPGETIGAWTCPNCQQKVKEKKHSSTKVFLRMPRKMLKKIRKVAKKFH